MELMCGKVTAKGSKEKVLEMYSDLENYYDKNILEEKEEDGQYCIIFDFSSGSFFEFEYFQGYSEEYDCYICAEMTDEEGMGPLLRLEYDKGEIIKGLEYYGLNDI